jgi:hypothetical protein
MAKQKTFLVYKIDHNIELHKFDRTYNNLLDDNYFDTMARIMKEVMMVVYGMEENDSVRITIEIP